MTVGEAMERAEELRPGSRVAARTRQRWLCEVDGMLRERFFRHQQHVVIPQTVVPRNVRAHALPAVGAAGPEKFLPQHPVHLAQPALPGAGRDTAARAQLFGSLHRFCRAFLEKAKGGFL